MRTLFKADWVDASFIHFAIDPQILQPHVPLPLDLLDGKAMVSLVAFTQKRLRPAWGGRITELLSTPLAEHEFLNLRTYVRVNGEPAIFFLAEWIPNRLAQLIGPITYGLPYRLGRLTYHTRDEMVGGCVRASGAPFRFAGQRRPMPRTADTNFLLERYCAYTLRNGVARRFRIAHEPWRVERLEREQLDLGFLTNGAPWLRECRQTHAHFSRGVQDVQIAPPEITRRVCHRSVHRKMNHP